MHIYATMKLKTFKSQRKLIDLLRGIIGSGFLGTQEELLEVLRSKGHDVNQSTVSRTLKKIGAIKVHTAQGAKYQLFQKDLAPQFSRKISGLVRSIDFNESLIVVKTPAGSAMFVAGFIDFHFEDQILGTVAGDDTIFISPKNKELLPIVFQKLKRNLTAL